MGEVPTPEDHVDPGTPGGSARREFEKRRDAREQRIRGNHPRLGGLILALSDDPQSTRAWDTGATGEERLGARLNDAASSSLLVLHDRRIPRSRANIDHLAVTPGGVWVIDAKRYRGRPQLRVEGGLLRPRVEKVLVGSRDCTKLVDGVLKQVDVVRGRGTTARLSDVRPVEQDEVPVAARTHAEEQQVEAASSCSTGRGIGQALSALTAASASTRAAMPVAASSTRRLPWWRS